MNFDSGVKSYIVGKAEVINYFPVNERGEADISCRQCRFFRISSRSCALNNEVVAYPEKYVGAACPLKNETI